MTTQKDNFVLSKSESWKMFDEISPRYDLLNHLLSFGLDILWRKKLGTFLPKGTELNVLDLATGTGDVLITLAQNKNIKKGYGIDLADKMLEIGRTKIKHLDLNNKLVLQHGDANQIPFENNKFDVITMAFGIRNTPDPKAVLTEMHRVLNDGGRVLILEFSLPNNKFIRGVHLFYLRNIVPLVGALFSGHYQAYRYLNQTIETFPYGENFCQLMHSAGLKNITAHPLMFGAASIYQGDKLS